MAKGQKYGVPSENQTYYSLFDKFINPNTHLFSCWQFLLFVSFSITIIVTIIFSTKFSILNTFQYIKYIFQNYTASLSGLRICQLHLLQRGNTLPTKWGVLSVSLNCSWWWGSIYGVWNHLFIAITPRSTLIQSGSTCKGPICRSNTSVWKLLMFGGNTWNYNSENVKLNLRRIIISYLKLCNCENRQIGNSHRLV